MTNITSIILAMVFAKIHKNQQKKQNKTKQNKKTKKNQKKKKHKKWNFCLPPVKSSFVEIRGFERIAML